MVLFAHLNIVMPRPNVPKCFSQANSLCASVVKSTFSMKTFIKGPTLSNVGSTLKFSMEVSTFEFSIESDDDDSRFGGFVRDNSSDNLSTTKSLKWNVMTVVYFDQRTKIIKTMKNIQKS